MSGAVGGVARRSHAALAAAIGLAIAASVLLTETLRYPGTTKLYPSAILVGLLVLAVGVAWQNTRPSIEATPGEQVGGRYVLRPSLFAAVWLTYPLIMMLVGFVVATTLAMTLSLWLLKIKRLPVWIAGVVPTVVFLLVVLQVLFNVALPQAPLDMAITTFFYSL